MSDTTDKPQQDPLARIHSRNGAEPEGEPDKQPDDDLSIPHRDSRDLDGRVRYLHADVRNAEYRIETLAKNVKREHTLTMATLAILWATIVLVSRRLDTVVRAVRELRGAVA